MRKFVISSTTGSVTKKSAPAGECTHVPPAPAPPTSVETAPSLAPVQPISSILVPITIKTPLKPELFSAYLSDHPDRVFVARLTSILTEGADIGFVGERFSQIAPNSQSAVQYANI